MEASDDADNERNISSSFAAAAAAAGGGGSDASPVQEDNDDNDSDDEEEEEDDDDEDSEDSEEQEEGSEEEDRKMPALEGGASTAAAAAAAAASLSITTSGGTGSSTFAHAATSSSSRHTTITTASSSSSTTKKGKRKQSAIMGLSPDERWEEMFQRLTKFKKINGHCQVPNRYREDASLGCWVSTQRRLHKKAQQLKGEGLNPERTARLEQLGFEWTGENPRHKNWDIRYEELKAFKAKYGHAQVPIGFEENVQLANWTSTQRQEYKNLLKGKPSRLSKERIKLLNDIGFAWELQRGGRRRLVTNRTSDSSRGSSASGKNTASVVLPGVALLGGDERLKRVAPKRTPRTNNQTEPSPSPSTSSVRTSTSRESGNAPAPLPGTSVMTATTIATTTTQSASVARSRISPTSRIQAGASSLLAESAMLHNIMIHNRNAFGRSYEGANNASSASQLLLSGHGALAAAQLTPYQQALLLQTAHQSQATMPFNPMLLSNNVNMAMAIAGQALQRAPMPLLQSLVLSSPTSLPQQHVSSAGMPSSALSNPALHRAALMIWQQQQHELQQQSQQQQTRAAASTMLPATLQAMSRSTGGLVEAKSEDVFQQQRQQQHNQQLQRNNQELEERRGSSSAPPPKKRKHR